MSTMNALGFAVIGVALAATGPVNAQTRKVGDLVPNELLVRFSATPSPQKIAALSSAGVARHRFLSRSRHSGSRRVGRWVRVVLSPRTNLFAAMRRIASHPFVADVVPNTYAELYEIPSDPSFPSQWNHENTGQTGGTPGADAALTEAWDIGTGGGNVVVAITDTGVDCDHEDLAANMWTNPNEVDGNGLDDDGNGYVDDVFGIDLTFQADPCEDLFHGTHVAGIVGAVGDNGVGISGVNWTTQLMSVKWTYWFGRTATCADASEAIDYVTTEAAQDPTKAWVINASWGVADCPPLRDAVSDANDEGVLIVASAGNDAQDNDALTSVGPRSYDFPNVISVAMTDHDDLLSTLSNFGDESVDLAAPGVSILSTAPNDMYVALSGTSMASPHVAGAAALLFSHVPELSARQVKSLLMLGADPLATLRGFTIPGPSFFGAWQGGRRLNVHASLLLAVFLGAGAPDYMECDDGVDNDGDGKVDYPDDPGCPSAYGREQTQCDDGIDNDSDGLVDSADSGCTDITPTSEN